MVSDLKAGMLPAAPKVVPVRRTQLVHRRGPISTNALLSFFTNLGKKPAKVGPSSKLLELVSETNLGSSATSPSLREEILKTVDELCALQEGQPTTGSDLSATWKVAWTTEKVLNAKSDLFRMPNAFRCIFSRIICSLGDPLHIEECQVVWHRGWRCLPGELCWTTIFNGRSFSSVRTCMMLANPTN